MKLNTKEIKLHDSIYIKLKKRVELIYRGRSKNNDAFVDERILIRKRHAGKLVGVYNNFLQ